MTCVVFTADFGGKHLFDELGLITAALSPLLVWRGHARMRGKAAEIIITDRESFRRIDIAPRILLCVGKQRHSLAPFAGSHSTVIVDSCEPTQLEAVAQTGLPAITCGLFRQDSITLSSSTPESAVISLQRSITSHGGDICEPQEIPVKLSREADKYLLMAAAAIFLLTGNAERFAPE